MLAVLALGAPATAVGDASKGADGGDRQQRARHQLSEIKTRIEALQRSLAEKQRGRDSAFAELSATESELAAIARSQRRLDEAVLRVNARLLELTTREQAIHAEMHAHRESLARQLRMAYAFGHQDTLKLLLNGERTSDVPRLLRYHEFMTRKRRALIAELAASRADLGRVRETLSAEVERLGRLQIEQTEELARRRSERDRRTAIVARIDRELGDEQSRLADLSRNRTRLEGLVRELEQAISDVPRELEPPRSFASLRGRLPWPVAGRRIQRFNEPRGDSGMRWQGVVLAAEAGREVRAVANGRVVFADWLRGFGLLVILDHGGGYMSLYGHNEALLREPGEWVNPGDAIATVGDSGGMSRPGLYFEIRSKGRPENPARWCSDRARFRAALYGRSSREYASMASRAQG